MIIELNTTSLRVNPNLYGNGDTLLVAIEVDDKELMSKILRKISVERLISLIQEASND
jgi:hypothetical protein